MTSIPIPLPAGTRLPDALDGAIVALDVAEDGTVTADIRIPAPGEAKTEAAGADMGRVAYEAYTVSCGGRSVRGDKLPTWPAQAADIREHWRAAADAVLLLTDLRTAADPPDAAARRAFRAFSGVIGADGTDQAWAARQPIARQAWAAAAAAARDDGRQ